MKKNTFALIFGWMFLGLLVTFGTSFYLLGTAEGNNILLNLFSNSASFWIIFLIEIGLVIFLSARATRMNYGTAAVTFMIYSWFSGLTFTFIIAAYQIYSVIFIFLVAALLFGLIALIGYFTKVDLSKWGTYLFMALIGCILVLVLNMFLNISFLENIISMILVFVFMGMTAYDMQKLKRLSHEVSDPRSIAIIGALELYLDFINLFINLLSLFGRRN